MSLEDVVESMATGTYTVTRRDLGTYAMGRAAAATPSTFSTKLVVQPVDGNTLMRLPEGMRAEEIRAVWSPVELRTQSAAGQPDSISIDGDDWEVQSLNGWSAAGGYWKALVKRVPR